MFRRLRQVQREICSPAETLCLLMAGPSRTVPPWGPNWRWTSALHLGNHRSFRVLGRLLSPPDEPMMLPFFSFRYEFVEKKDIPTCDAGGSATQDGAGRNKKGLRPRASIRYLQVRDSIPRNSSCDKLQHPQHAQPSPYLVAAWGRLESSPSSAMHPPAGSSQQPVPGAPVGVGAPRGCNCYLERQRPAPTGMIARCVVAVVGREQSKPGPEGGERSGAEQVGRVAMVQNQREGAV